MPSRAESAAPTPYEDIPQRLNTPDSRLRVAAQSSQGGRVGTCDTYDKKRSLYGMLADSMFESQIVSLADE